MQEQIPSSNPAQVDEQPQYEQTYQEPTFNPENIESLKARARDLAMQQAIAARGMQPLANPMATPPLAQPHRLRITKHLRHSRMWFTCAAI
jgi:hypothetical protein